jgi:hypothetical protein
VDDTSNWEFAAAVAAVSIGLGGLLLFTLIAAIGSWRVFERAGDAATEAAKASAAIEELARQMAARDEAATRPVAQAHVEELRRQADALKAQQLHLEDALLALIAAGGGTSSDADARRLERLESALARLGENVDRMSAAVADLVERR